MIFNESLVFSVKEQSDWLSYYFHGSRLLKTLLTFSELLDYLDSKTIPVAFVFIPELFVIFGNLKI